MIAISCNEFIVVIIVVVVVIGIPAQLMAGALPLRLHSAMIWLRSTQYLDSVAI
jgi:hypothetical protein